MITYGVATDATDDYVCSGESTTLKSSRRFVVVVHVFRPEYMTLLNEQDTARLLAIDDESRGFSGNAWLHRLHVLDVEKLPYWIERYVSGT
jgi:hypothetical protein